MKNVAEKIGQVGKWITFIVGALTLVAPCLRSLYSLYEETFAEAKKEEVKEVE